MMAKSILSAIALLLLSGASHGQVAEVEPNDVCAMPQDVGEPILPLIIEGELESSDDVDFFRFLLKPDARVRVDMVGQTLSDPFLGLFDSQCDVVAINDDFGSLDSRLEFFVPQDGVIILGATRCCDGGFDGGGGTGTYTLNVIRIPPPARSITGRLTNAITGEPLSGDSAPFASARLYRCSGDSCNFLVANRNASDDGRFLFESDGNLIIEPDTYQIEGRANDFESVRSATFDVGPNQDLHVGDINLLPPQASFSELVGCNNIPPEGGLCLYSVRITNNRLDTIDGRVWSIVDVNGTGSPHGFSSFQAEPVLNDFTLGPLESERVIFSFEVDEEVDDFASFCPQIYISGNPSNYTDTLEGASPFCVSRVNGAWKFESLKESNARRGVASGNSEVPHGPASLREFGPASRQSPVESPRDLRE